MEQAPFDRYENYDKYDFADDVAGTINIIVLCYPDEFDEEDKSYDYYKNILFEQWEGFKNILKQPHAEVAFFEKELLRALHLIETEEDDRPGMFLLQELEVYIKKTLVKLK